MKTEFYWTFQIEASRFCGVMGPSCDFVTEENREACQEIMETECHQSYGILNKEMLQELSFTCMLMETIDQCFDMKGQDSISSAKKDEMRRYFAATTDKDSMKD